MDGNIENQKADGSNCQNNFECTSNSCNNGKCINLEKQINEQGNKINEQGDMLQQIMNWLVSIFGVKFS